MGDLGGFGRVLEWSARSVGARVASERSWKAISEDLGSKKVPKMSQTGCQESFRIEILEVFPSKHVYKIEVYCFTVTLS